MLQIKRSEINYVENLVERILTEAVDILGLCDDTTVHIYDSVRQESILIGYNPVSGNGYWPVCTFNICDITKEEFIRFGTVQGQMEEYGLELDEAGAFSEMTLDAILSSLQSFLKNILVTETDKKLEIILD